MKWIDFNYTTIKNDPNFNDVIENCESKKLKHILGFKYDWSDEIICQFYATLYFDHDNARTIHWMTEGRWPV